MLKFRASEPMVSNIITTYRLKLRLSIPKLTQSVVLNLSLSTIIHEATINVCVNNLRLESINFQHEFNNRKVHSAYEFFHRTLTTLIENNVPKKTVTNYPNKPKWWTRELQRRKNRRDKLFKRKPKGTLTDEYVTACREFNEFNDSLHKEYINSVQNNIKLNPAEFWKFAKIGNKQSTYPNQMRYNNDIAKSPDEIVQCFAKYFESISAYGDYKDAFNRVWHRRLVEKIAQFGLGPKTAKWLYEFIANGCMD